MIDAKQIEGELSSLMDGWAVVLETSAENALEAGLVSIKILTGKGYNGIVLSASRPYANLLTLYRNNGIDTERILFMDCITKSQSSTPPQAGNVMYLDGLSALTNISISIDKAIKQTVGNKFIFIDSLTTLLIYNEPGVFARFIHSILTKTRINGVNSLLIYLESETNREVRAEITQLCDRVIKV